jgi:hypothetical protein
VDDVQMAFESSMLELLPVSSGSLYEKVARVLCNSLLPVATDKNLVRPNPTGIEALIDESDVQAKYFEKEDPMANRFPAVAKDILHSETVT